jgi:RNA polymerase sigma-70 factor (ECF subfamily)
MDSKSLPEVTELLSAWSDGDKTALDRLTPIVYEELRKLARHFMSRERPNHTLQTTALVNEAYLKLFEQTEVTWQSRAQFFGLAAQVMRHILVDYARAASRAKRGGKAAEKVSLEDASEMSAESAREFVELDEALHELEKEFPRKAKVVELRYFGGFSVEETAGILQISAVTVMRDWNVAKAWLYRKIKNEG